MNTVAAALSFLLALIAALHAYWAFGGLWPATTERELINTVIGNAAMGHMPPVGMALTVAALILAMAVIPLALIGGIKPVWFVRLAAGGAGLIFFARGVAGYFFSTIAWTPVEPFASLNRLYYSPLCLLIGFSFFLLVFLSINSNEGLTR